MRGSSQKKPMAGGTFKEYQDNYMEKISPSKRRYSAMKKQMDESLSKLTIYVLRIGMQCSMFLSILTPLSLKIQLADSSVLISVESRIDDG